MQETLDAVENLIKKHEAFEKSAATQEERFLALERLTTVCCIFAMHINANIQLSNDADIECSSVHNHSLSSL